MTKAEITFWVLWAVAIAGAAWIAWNLTKTNEALNRVLGDDQ